jgi:hypothetical protein
MFSLELNRTVNRRTVGDVYLLYRDMRPKLKIPNRSFKAISRAANRRLRTEPAIESATVCWPGGDCTGVSPILLSKAGLERGTSPALPANQKRNATIQGERKDTHL